MSWLFPKPEVYLEVTVTLLDGQRRMYRNVETYFGMRGFMICHAARESWLVNLRNVTEINRVSREHTEEK